MPENGKASDIEKLPGAPKSSNPMKMFLIGLPIFVVQLVVVYFITANVLIKSHQAPLQSDNAKQEAAAAESKESQASGEVGKFIFPVEDIIINPAGTDGKRLLLLSLGLDVGKEEHNNELKSKEVLVKDIVISVLSSKKVEQLSESTYKDSLRVEITGVLKTRIPNVKINDIYFSKYILQ